MSSKRGLSPRKLPRQARSRATVQAVLEAATQVFCTYGYAGGTTDKVAERAGVSIGSLYQYFPNKESLLLALAQQHMEEGFELIETLLQESKEQNWPLEVILREFIEALMKLHRQNPTLHRVLFNEAPLPPAFTEEKERREKLFAEQLANLLQEYHEIKVPDMRLTSYILVQSVEGLVHSFIIYPPEQIEAEALVEEMVRMLQRYLT